MKNFKGLAFSFGILAIAIIMALALTVGLTSYGKLSFATTYTSNVAASVNVPSVCGIGLSVGSIGFGAISPGTNTGATTNSVVDTNTGGDISAIIFIRGTDWTSAANTILSSNTQYNVGSTFTYPAGTAMPNTMTTTGSTVGASPSNTVTVYFGLGVPFGALAGIYSSNIVIENSC